MIIYHISQYQMDLWGIPQTVADTINVIKRLNTGQWSMNLKFDDVSVEDIINYGGSNKNFQMNSKFQITDINYKDRIILVEWRE